VGVYSDLKVALFSKKKVMKKLYSSQEKYYHVSQWRASGQSMKSYSVSAGICYQTFYNWAKSPEQTESSIEQAGDFLAVGLQAPALPDKPRAEVDLGHGIILRVY